jgi:hypothetical protein
VRIALSLFHSSSTMATFEIRTDDFLFREICDGKAGME